MSKKTGGSKKPKRRRKAASVKVEIAKALRRYACPIYIRRQMLGWSLDDLAEACGEDKALLSRVETGSRNPTLRFIAAVSDSFNIPPGQLADELQHWAEQEVTEENAEQLVLDSFYAYGFEAPRLSREWEIGMTLPTEGMELEDGDEEDRL